MWRKRGTESTYQCWMNLCEELPPYIRHTARTHQKTNWIPYVHIKRKDRTSIQSGQRGPAAAASHHRFCFLFSPRGAASLCLCGRLTTNTTSRLHHLALAGRLGLASHFSYLVRPDQTRRSTTHHIWIDGWTCACTWIVLVASGVCIYAVSFFIYICVNI
jgi:hypothetical protein